MPRGRPTDLTPEIQKTIVDALLAGAYIETAAAIAGISKVTFYKWARRGSREKRRLEKRRRARPSKRELPFISFVNAIKEAMAKSELADVLRIAKASQTQWQAAAWRLERKHPGRWGRREHLEHTGKDGGPIRTQVVSDKTVAEIRRRMIGDLIEGE